MKHVFLSVIFLLPLLVHAQVQAPAASPYSELHQTVGLTDVVIEYSRPSMKGREVFGNLVPYGKIWRTGANATTKITIDKPITLDGKELKAGTYSLYTIPDEDVWEIVFYTDHANPLIKTFDESKVALRANMESYELPVGVETFTITIDNIKPDGASLGLFWEDTFVDIPFTVNTDDEVMASIDAALNGPGAEDYFAAAVYYLNSGKDIQKAKNWMNKAMEMTDDPKFWQLRQQSLILAKAGDKKEAIKVAKASLEGAKQAGNNDYIKMNQDSLKEWGAM